MTAMGRQAMTHRPSEPSDSRESSPPADPRIAAFCSKLHPGLFHAVAYANDIWRKDPFDVESIHSNVRASFAEMVQRVRDPAALPTGRMLLLLGDSGSGKTHLMRAFRNAVHSAHRGYCGYMQMTAFTTQYGRYVLNNLIESLDKPYHEPESPDSGLMQLSRVLAESLATDAAARAELEKLREGDIDQNALDLTVGAMADRILLDDRFRTIDVYIVQALLYLQHDDPRIKARVLKYLRCEDLTDHDRRLLGGIVPCVYPDAPHWVIQRLGELMWSLEKVPLILCVDQLEDMFDMEDPAAQFRRSLATLCDLVSRLPSCLVVISCLQDYYDNLKALLRAPVRSRIQGATGPIKLKETREGTEVTSLIAERLKFFYEKADAPFTEEEPTFPFPSSLVNGLSGMGTRDVLNACQAYRDRCVMEGRLVDHPFDGTVDPPQPPPPVKLEQAWNELRSGVSPDVPTEEPELAAVLSKAIRDCAGELTTGHDFNADVDGRFIPVEIHAPDDSVERIFVGVCNKGAQGGGLKNQLDEMVQRAGEHFIVVVRSTAFPGNPNTLIAKRLGELVAAGARRVVVEDSDWRTMLAFASFQEAHRVDPTFAAWRTETRPLTGLKSLRLILDLDRLESGARMLGPDRAKPPENSTSAGPGDPPSTVLSPPPWLDTPPHPSFLLTAGRSRDRHKEDVTLDSAELTRHAAFLGAPGSGKTTVALGLVEQLLIRGIPAILIDRKGDLCSYASAGMGLRDGLEGELAERAAQLRHRVDVALYTPRRADGRPLSIAAVPAGLGSLPDDERTQAARIAAAALGGMMNYQGKARDKPLLAILGRAIDLISRERPQEPVPIQELIDFIGDEDPDLVGEVGRLDVKLFKKLVQDLETLRLSHGDLLAATGEPLDIEALLGRGPHAVAGKTRLSIISTKFLGSTQDVQFWVAQFLMNVGRWISRSPAPDGSLQAVILFDEADLYLPAVRQPASKEPMEHLIRRARSAGLGLLLATQSPGDFDYRCRENLRAWFVGQVKEANSIAKMKPMLSECRLDVSSHIPSQTTGEFYLIRDGMVIPIRTERSAVDARQIPEEEILNLARRTARG